jgi:glycosyltransferase involved in cell wall biosynthesis
MKLAVLTDMDSSGSGYRSICIPLLTGLANLGYEIYVAGLMYRGDEHNYPISIIPVNTVQEGKSVVANLIQLGQADVVIVALDLPLQHQMIQELVKFGKPYIAITPLENGPLTMSWAAPLLPLDAIFFISELGKQEAIKAGIAKAEHLVVGVDTESWRPVDVDEKKRLRQGLGIDENTFVVLTVADNQERKNLWAGMKAVSLLKKEIDRPIKYIMVTREHSPYGWKLRDMAMSIGINQEYMPFERGMPRRDLWALYAVSDVYMQPSKAEGLGMPVLDAMACGVPVVATDTGAMHELLEGRGFLIPPEYSFTDVWGNSLRDMIDIGKAKDALKIISLGEQPIPQTIPLEYVKARTWDVPVQQVHQAIERIHEQKKSPA